MIAVGGWGWAEDASSEEDDDETGLASATAGVHLSLRDQQSYIVGGFGALQTTSVVSEDELALHGMIGVEAAAFLGNFTIYGQGGYFDALAYDHDASTLGDLWFVRGVGRYFLGMNTRLQGEVLYGEGRNVEDIDDPDDFDVLMWGAEIAHRLSSAPITVFAGYEGLYMHEPAEPANFKESDELTEHRVIVGFRIPLGTSSYVEENVAGATLDLPDFSRPVSYYSCFDEFENTDCGEFFPLL